MSYKFLVVDDTSFMRKMAADCLMQYGHIVVGEAVNGKEAVQKFKELQPEVVMMDLTMPEMNGVDAIKEIISINKEAVILVCSANNQKDLIQEALNAGAVGYLMKPFKPDYMNEIIKKYAEPFLKVEEEETEELASYEKEEEVEASIQEAAAAIEEVTDVTKQENAVTQQVRNKEESVQHAVAPVENKVAEPVSSIATEYVRPTSPVTDSKFKFVTSYICNWNEEVKGERKNFSLTYTENDQNICIEMIGSNNEKQTIHLSLDGFREVHSWLETRIAEGRSSR